MVSIKDIALECKVSTTTVSRALNDSKEISKETRDKILRVCKEKGYIPNSAARSLILKKTNMIGLIIPDITNQYYSYVSKGVSSYLDSIGYGLILCNSDRNKDNEKKYLAFLSEKRVDGIILIPIKPKSQDYIDVIKNLPIVFVDNYVKDLDASFVGNDNYIGSKTIITHMINQGYKRIGVILGDNESTASNERLNGYIDTLRQYKVSYDNDIVINSTATFEDGFKIAGKLIEKNVDSIFAINDTVAMGVMKYCYLNNIKIPNDLGIAGYDDIEQSSMLPVPLTTVHQKKATLGEAAANLLINEIKNKVIDKQKLILQPSLIIRNSCRE